MESVQLRKVADATEALRRKLLAHPLYGKMSGIQQLRLFTEYHGYAVLDFMSLLKALQRELTCVGVPWVPRGEPEVRALINQIVLGEESDRDPEGRVNSHYELYLRAMREMGARTGALETFARELAAGVGLNQAFEEAGTPEAVRKFVSHTFEVIASGQTHRIAAAFTFGREDLLPGVFTEMVKKLASEEPGRVELFRYYLERHIDLDGGEHGEMGLRMVAGLCGGNPERWEEVQVEAVRSLEARLALWDAIEVTLAGMAGGTGGDSPATFLVAEG